MGREAGRGAGGGGEGPLALCWQRALLAVQTIGLGRVLYLAGYQTWRFRNARGNLQDRFWGQVVGWAVGSDLPAGGGMCGLGQIGRGTRRGRR